MKKCTVKIKPVANKASSEWIIVATLMIQPGRKRVKSSGNQSINPVLPIIATPHHHASATLDEPRLTRWILAMLLVGFSRDPQGSAPGF